MAKTNMAVEVRPAIYRPGTQIETSHFPPYIKPVDTNKLLINAKVKEGKAGPFDKIFDFGFSREALKSPVPAEERITASIPGIEYLGFTNTEVLEAMEKITEINTRSKPDNELARFSYQFEMSKVFKHVSDRVSELVVGDAVYFPPMRGAEIVKSFFKTNGFDINSNNTVDYELKRTLIDSGQFLVGANYKHLPKGNFQTAVILDDCLASDVSASATVYEIMETYPGVKNVIVAVSAASQRGVESLRAEFEGQGINLQIVAATPVYELSEDFYLMRTQEEGYQENVQYVGDMGSWGEKLSSRYDPIAAWNALRK